MAISWSIQITPLDVSRKEASINATRTDDVTEDVRIYGPIRAILGSAAQKLAVLDQVWAMYQADLAEEAAVAAFIEDMEADAKANLEGRE